MQDFTRYVNFGINIHIQAIHSIYIHRKREYIFKSLIICICLTVNNFSNTSVVCQK